MPQGCEHQTGRGPTSPRPDPSLQLLVHTLGAGLEKIFYPECQFWGALSCKRSQCHLNGRSPRRKGSAVRQAASSVKGGDLDRSGESATGTRVRLLQCGGCPDLLRQVVRLLIPPSYHLCGLTRACDSVAAVNGNDFQEPDQEETCLNFGVTFPPEASTGNASLTHPPPSSYPSMLIPPSHSPAPGLQDSLPGGTAFTHAPR